MNNLGQDYCMQVFPDDQHARVHIYSLAVAFRIWSKPHYRSKSFQHDLLANLSNVAIPGTGIPLSMFCHLKITAYMLVFFINPFVCLLAAINKANKEKTSTYNSYLNFLCNYYKQHLLRPDDWFSFWQLNCRLASYHSGVTSSPGWALEDKWTFLLAGDKVGVPITPFNKKDDAVVVKHKSIEGGMGIHFYKNAAHGGDWIIQEKIKNISWLNKLLPSNPPLSTMRVITCSTWSLTNDHQPDSCKVSNEGVDKEVIKYVKALSSVLRLGRADASTDHSSVLFDVDIATGKIKKGITNAHWYQLWTTSGTWLPGTDFQSHPDPPYPQVTDKFIPDMKAAVDVVTTSHFKMMADVPLVGWDVAFTETGIQLLEVNLSCNFFRGSFNLNEYLDTMENFFQCLDEKNKLSSSSVQAVGDSNTSTSASNSNSKKKSR